ncbi:hypothetical protein NDU88_003241 [Pleurodeles waltl]|uniref:Uncharacterized protein n=1 Tax=Pleurodeles waltl TaxID=8319 RepID=A0AAV7MQM3_PLEWA|nr:hypothetical protein NDU88_003241 [Pleurodeles waltl]
METSLTVNYCPSSPHLWLSPADAAIATPRRFFCAGLGAPSTSLPFIPPLFLAGGAAEVLPDVTEAFGSRCLGRSTARNLLNCDNRPRSCRPGKNLCSLICTASAASKTRCGGGRVAGAWQRTPGYRAEHLPLGPVVGCGAGWCLPRDGRLVRVPVLTTATKSSVCHHNPEWTRWSRAIWKSRDKVGHQHLNRRGKIFHPGMPLFTFWFWLKVLHWVTHFVTLSSIGSSQIHTV